ncbi:MAG: NADPH:quinone oxidoreductase family protein [Ilumatobacteraceae bacterium]
MRAVICHEYGPVDRLVVEESPTPEPGPGQVRVAVKAAGASFVDGLQVAGKYQFPQQPPYTPGGECAGVVDAIGEGVDGWTVGDRVFATTGNGAMADTVLASPQQLIRLPESIDFAIGATFLQVYGTAWFALKHRTVVRPGEVMLVSGAGGGVGLAAIDVARSLGAEVIAVASSEEKRALAMQAGAFAAIDPTSEDVKVRARELTDGKGIDLVYDVTGGEVSEAALRALKFDGRFLVIGFTAGISRIPLNLVLLNNRTVVGVEWGGWVGRNREANRAMIDEIVAAIGSGSLHPVQPTERPLEDAGQVLSDLLERRAVGKIVLVP